METKENIFRMKSTLSTLLFQVRVFEIIINSVLRNWCGRMKITGFVESYHGGLT
jgi:hypothetical protein